MFTFSSVCLGDVLLSRLLFIMNTTYSKTFSNKNFDKLLLAWIAFDKLKSVLRIKKKRIILSNDLTYFSLVPNAKILIHEKYFGAS